MSLLMDALRRAEAEKRAAGGGAREDGGQGVTGSPAGGELQLEPLGDGPRDPGDTSTLSLEPAEGPPAAEPEERPSEEAVRRAVEDYLDGSQSAAVGERSVEPRAELTGEVVGTPVTAQTVFAATRRRRSRAPWLIGAAVLLAAALLVAGAALYLAGIPQPRPLPALPVAGAGHAPPVPIELPAVQRPPTAAAAIEATTATVAATGGGETGAAQTTGSEGPASPPTPGRAGGQAAGPAPEAGAAAAGPKPPAEADGRPAPAAGPGPAATPPPPLTISRGRSAARPSAGALAAAWRAFRVGDLAGAERHYRQVLAREPGNRAALLGLAALALARGEETDARARYRQVLERYPDDVAARVALIALEGRPADPRLLAALQVAAERSPAAGLVYFTLGNHHARAGRWPEAERAYFEALRAEPDNPDYAFNLAVSLEHLGQRRAAASYYRRALDNATTRPAVFPAAAARERLAALTAASAGSGAAP